LFPRCLGALVPQVRGPSRVCFASAETNRRISTMAGSFSPSRRPPNLKNPHQQQSPTLLVHSPFHNLCAKAGHRRFPPQLLLLRPAHSVNSSPAAIDTRPRPTITVVLPRRLPPCHCIVQRSPCGTRSSPGASLPRAVSPPSSSTDSYPSLPSHCHCSASISVGTIRP
jgi:hypothetical protein